MADFIDKLIDWREFELFVSKLYETGDPVRVQHDVTMVGRSGAKRQIDVLVTVQHVLHAFTALVECKRWKDKVDRSRVDVLAAAVEDLRASKGVMFTTVGYEEGAEKYAREKGIDIFVIREMTAEEWGLPGRIIRLGLRTFIPRFARIGFPDAKALVLGGEVPAELNLTIAISEKDREPASETLHSVIDGEPGPNLVTVLTEAALEVMKRLPPVLPPLPADITQSRTVVVVPLSVNLGAGEYRRLHRPGYFVDFGSCEVNLHVHVHHTRMEFDRGDKFDIALMVEDYVTRRRHIATKLKASDGVTVEVASTGSPPDPDGEAPLENDSIFNLFCEPWVGVDCEPTMRIETNALEVAVQDLPSVRKHMH
jgi:hypothetical protein